MVELNHDVLNLLFNELVYNDTILGIIPNFEVVPIDGSRNKVLAHKAQLCEDIIYRVFSMDFICTVGLVISVKQVIY